MKRTNHVPGGARIMGGVAGLCLGLATTTSMAQVAWRTAPDLQPQTSMTPAQASTALQDLSARADQKRVVIELSGVASDAQRQAMADAGVTLLKPLGGASYFASVDANRLAPVLAAQLGGVRSARAIRPEWKMHPLVAGDAIPGFALVEGEPDVEAGLSGQRVAAYVLFHADAPLADGVDAVGFFGGRVTDRIESVNGLVVELPRENLQAFADHDDVQWIEPALPQLSTMNAENRVQTQVNEVEQFEGLTGQGVRVMVFDGGTMNANHSAFFNGVFSRVQVRDNDGVSDHATHVGGTVGGSGAGSSGGAHRGMAPEVFIDSFGFQFSGGGVFLYSNPGDIETDYDAAINTFGSDISNNSIGTNTATNGFPCEITGDYGVTSNLIDTIVGGGLGTPFRIVWANGNERQSTNCGNLYYTTAPPATAKNHLTVGAIEADTEEMTSFSSWGPTDDGRMKPDVSAPGCQVGGDGGVTSSGSGGGYNVKCGTSMAAPTVTGIGALLLEAYRDKYPYRPDFRNSTLRALLAHTAKDLGNDGPDHQFGYGAVQAQDAVDHLQTGSMSESAVTDGASVIIPITVTPEDQRFRVTLAWDDAPGVPNVEVALVNQLDLVVTDPEGARHFPFHLDPSDPGAPATQDQENTLDNIEQVVVVDPIPGAWTIEVRGTSVPEGPQPFSLVATPDLTSLFLGVVGGASGLTPPGEPITVDVALDLTGQDLESAELFYRTSAEQSFQSATLTPVDDSLFTATIPAPLCGDIVEYYAAATGSVTGEQLDPAGAPFEVFGADVGELDVLLEDDLEATSGWTVGAPGDDAATGQWELADPQATSAQPGDDHTEDGTLCFVTGAEAGNGNGSFDIDGGQTTLISPIIDASGGGDPVLSYWRWYSNSAGGAPNQDVFIVDISNDGGDSWVNLETVGPDGPGTSGGWVLAQFTLADVITPTDQLRLRFIASDEGEGSLVEAAIDDLRIDSLGCDFVPPIECDGDITGDNAVNSSDLNMLLAVFGTDNDDADLNNDGAVNSADLNILLGNFGNVCE